MIILLTAKCLRYYVKSLKIKSDKAKLWRSIWLVMKKISAPSDVKIQPNSAKMLKKLCLKNDDVTYCLVEKKLVKQSCGEVSV